MLPLDVKPERLKNYFLPSRKPECLGGAIAVPYKEKMFNLTQKTISQR